MDKTVDVYEKERIDDLLSNNLKIIQSEEVFSFSLDAVLLARFCSVPAKGEIIDLCTGNGAIPLLLSTRTRASITGIEIQLRLVDMAKRSVALNKLEQQINIIEGDIKEAHKIMRMRSFNLVTVNPPYLPVHNGMQNVNEYVAIARHELLCTLEDVIAASSRLTATGGKVAMVHRPARLTEIMTLMRSYKLEPKRIRFVHPRADEEANMVLIEAIKDGKTEVRLLPPVIVYNKNGEYSDELAEIFYGRSTELKE